jgi:hypothetical protein
MTAPVRSKGVVTIPQAVREEQYNDDASFLAALDED